MTQSIDNQNDATSLQSAVLFLAVLCVSLAIWVIAPMLSIEQGMGDSDRYFAIASNPFELTASPWGYRIIVPWLARAVAEVSPLSIEQAFFGLQFAFYLSINLFVVVVCRSIGASKLMMVMAMLTFAAGYQFVYYRFNYMHVGMAELSLQAWLCWWLYKRQFGLVAIALALSVPLKESVAFVFLQVMVLHWIGQWITTRKPDMKLAHLIGLCILPIAIFLLMRLSVSAEGQSAAESYLSGYDKTFFHKLFGPHFFDRLVEYFTVYGVLLLVVVAALKRCLVDEFARLQMLVFLVGVTQLLLALDTRRMASVAMISVIILAVRLGQSPKYRVPVICAMVLQCFYALLWLNQYHVAAVVCLCTAVGGAFAWVFNRWHKPAAALG